MNISSPGVQYNQWGAPDPAPPPIAPRRPLGADHARRRCWIQVSVQFTKKMMSSRISESAIATSKLPFPVSSTVAVVKTLVERQAVQPDSPEDPVESSEWVSKSAA